MPTGIPGQHGANNPAHGTNVVPNIQHGANPPTLAILTLASVSYTSALTPGQVVGNIVGRTPGSALLMSGLAFTSNKLAISGNDIVAGSAAPLLAADTTGAFDITETFVGGILSPRTTPFGSITVV